MTHANFLIISSGSSSGVDFYGHVLLHKMAPQTNRKSTRHPFRTLPKPFKNQPKTLPGDFRKKRTITKTAFFRLFSIFDNFRMVPTAFSPPKSEKNRNKVALQNVFFFYFDFSSIFPGFGFPKRDPNPSFLEPFSKTCF